MLGTIGKLLLGLGLSAEAVNDLRERRRTQLLGPQGVNGLGRMEAGHYNTGLPRNVLPGENEWAGSKLVAAKTVITKARQHTLSRGANSIDERLGHIIRLIKEGSLKPEVIEAARAIVSRKCGTEKNKQWCLPPKDYKREVMAVYRAVQDANSDLAVRYVRDHVAVDQFAAPEHIWKIRGGDCDDGTILLASLLSAIGYPVRCRVIQDISSPTWSHIYLLVGLPPTGPSVWVPLDWSVYPYKPPGWEAPPRIIKAKRDYEIKW